MGAERASPAEHLIHSSVEKMLCCMHRGIISFRVFVIFHRPVLLILGHVEITPKEVFKPELNALPCFMLCKRITDAVPRVWIEHQLEILIQLLQLIYKLNCILHMNVIVHRSVSNEEFSFILINVRKNRGFLVSFGILSWSVHVTLSINVVVELPVDHAEFGDSVRKIIRTFCQGKGSYISAVASARNTDF